MGACTWVIVLFVLLIILFIFILTVNTNLDYTLSVDNFENVSVSIWVVILIWWDALNLITISISRQSCRLFLLIVRLS